MKHKIFVLCIALSVIICSCGINKAKTNSYLNIKSDKLDALCVNPNVKYLTIELNRTKNKELNLFQLKESFPHIIQLRIENKDKEGSVSIVKVENMDSLQSIYMSDIGCDSLLVKNCGSLYRVNCSCNKMRWMKIDGCNKLSILSCNNNMLKNVSLRNVNLRMINCTCNNIDTFILNSSVDIEELLIGHNPIDSSSVVEIPDKVSWITICPEDTILMQVFKNYRLDTIPFYCNECPYTINISH